MINRSSAVTARDFIGFVPVVHVPQPAHNGDAGRRHGVGVVRHVPPRIDSAGAGAGRSVIDSYHFSRCIVIVCDDACEDRRSDLDGETL